MSGVDSGGNRPLFDDFADEYERQAAKGFHNALYDRR
jgi:hypothetical protein